MSYKDKTYIIFDGDKDQWAYRFMRGWKANKHVDFDFEDAHYLFTLTGRAQDESYIKRKLRERFRSACQVIILIGESTRYLYKYVRWELEVALELDLPIIAVNLDDKRGINVDRCPPLIKEKYIVHIPFRLPIIRYALDNFPAEYRNVGKIINVAKSYPESVYKQIGMS